MTHYISPAPLTFEILDCILNKNYKLALSEESKKSIFGRPDSALNF